MKKFVMDLVDRFWRSKSKSRAVLIGVFVVFLAWAVLSLVGHYFSKLSLDRGFMEVSGRIEGYEYHASARIPGEIVEMYVGEGDEVKAGQPVGRIRSKQLEAELGGAKARLELARIEHAHAAKLSERRAIAKIKLDQAEEAYSVAREAVNRAAADAEDALVLSPTDGVVAVQIVRPGEVVAAGTPLVSVVNFDDLFLKIFLSTEFAGKVSVGDEARIFPDALPKEGFDAVVTHVAEKAQFTPKNVETKSQRAKLVFEIKVKAKENPDRKLKPGMPSDGVIKISKDAKWSSYSR